LGRTRLAEGLACAEAFAELAGRTVRLAPAELALAPAELAAGELAGGELAGVERGELVRRPEAAVADGWLWVSFDVAGLNVATDSMAPATRHTARMLASSGITVPGPENGEVSRRSRRRRRRARSSRW
jgi:hypothetical protein